MTIARGETGAGARAVIHPAMVMAFTWGIALLAWRFASPAVVEATAITGERAGSMHAFWYFAGCLGLFGAGAVAASFAWPTKGRATTTSAAYPGLAGLAIWLAVATLAGGAVWGARIVLLAGSPLGLARLFLGGESVADLKFSIAIPAQLPPFTTLVHLTPAAASVLLLQRRAGGWTRLHWLLMAGLALLSVVRTFLLAERYAGLGFASSVGFTLLLTSRAMSWRRLAGLGFAGAVLGWFAWSGGEFTRSYMDSRDGEASTFTFANFRASLSYSQERLVAYVFTAIDNGVVIVEQSPGQAFPANFAPVLARAGLHGQVGAGDLYESALSPEFTGESMPGRFYLDARDAGVVLALLYGIVFGLAWRAAALGRPAGIVLYAGLSPVLLDSYRSAYLFDLQGLAAFGGAALVLVLAVPRGRSARLGRPVLPQGSSGARRAPFTHGAST